MPYYAFRLHNSFMVQLHHTFFPYHYFGLMGPSSGTLGFIQSTFLLLASLLTDYNQHWLCQQILIKFLDIKFNENSFSGSRVAACEPDRLRENMGDFLQTCIVNVPKRYLVRVTFFGFHIDLRLSCVRTGNVKGEALKYFL
jgi:hypothetical protein